MRLIEARDKQAEHLRCVEFLGEGYIRGRLPEVRPSALEKRGEAPLSEIGSLLHEVPDFFRYCRLCASMGCEHARVTAQLSRLERGRRARHSAPVFGRHLCRAGARG